MTYLRSYSYKDMVAKTLVKVVYISLYVEQGIYCVILVFMDTNGRSKSYNDMQTQF